MTVTNDERLAAAREAAEIMSQVNTLWNELQRRHQLEQDEFEGRAYFDVSRQESGKAEGGEEGLMIEGIAADWTQDREDEMFAQGAFDKGIEEFMKNPILVYSHSKPLFETAKGTNGYLQLGVVKSLTKDPERGLVMKAFVRKPKDEGFLMDTYERIKAGEMKGLSVGGYFKKVLGKIVSADLTEVSIAPRPVNRGTLINRVTPIKVSA